MLIWMFRSLKILKTIVFSKRQITSTLWCIHEEWRITRMREWNIAFIRPIVVVSPFTILGSRTAPYVRARSLARTFSRLRSSYILHMSGTLISLHSNLSNLSAYTHTFALVLLFHDDKFDSQIYDPQSVLNPT